MSLFTQFKFAKAEHSLLSLELTVPRRVHTKSIIRYNSCTLHQWLSTTYDHDTSGAFSQISSAQHALLCCTILELFDVEEWPWNLGYGSLKSLETAPVIRSHTSFYSSSIVTMTIYCIVSEMKRYIVRFFCDFHPLLHNTPLGKIGCEYFRAVFFTLSHIHNLSGGANRFWKKTIICLFTAHAHHRHNTQTDGQAISILDRSLRNAR